MLDIVHRLPHKPPLARKTKKRGQAFGYKRKYLYFCCRLRTDPLRQAISPLTTAFDTPLTGRQTAQAKRDVTI